MGGLLAACSPESPDLEGFGQLAARGLRFGGPGADRALGLTTAANGDAIVVAQVSGEVRVGRSTLEAGPAALLVTRLTRDVEVAWVRLLPFRGASLAQVRLAVDASDRVYVGATVQGGTLQLDNRTRTGEGSTDLLLVRLLQDELTGLWRFGGPGVQVLNGLGVSPSGDVWLSGRFEVWNGQPARSRSDAFVTRRREGAEVWTRLYGGDGVVAATTLAVAEDERAAVAVRFEANLRLGERRLSTSQVGTALLSLGPEGNVEALAQLEAESLELVSADVGAGVAHFGGSFRGELRAVRPRVESRARSQGSDGLWLRWPLAAPSATPVLDRIGGPGADLVRAVSADERGRTWLTGSFDGPFSLGPQRLDGRGARPPFAARIDGDGGLRRGAAFEDLGFSAGVAHGRAGTWWLGGAEEASDAAPDPLPALGGADIVLLRFEPG